jgi:hypothetical protein
LFNDKIGRKQMVGVVEVMISLENLLFIHPGKEIVTTFEERK